MQVHRGNWAKVATPIVCTLIPRNTWQDGKIARPSGELALYEPWDYNRLPDKIQDWIVDWMSKNLKQGK